MEAVRAAALAPVLSDASPGWAKISSSLAIPTKPSEFPPRSDLPQSLPTGAAAFKFLKVSLKDSEIGTYPAGALRFVP